MQAYDKPEVLWTELANQPDGTQNAWYNKAVAYWDNQEASVNGVLGGYGHVSDDDIMESRKFLLKVTQSRAATIHLTNQKVPRMLCRLTVQVEKAKEQQVCCNLVRQVELPKYVAVLASWSVTALRASRLWGRCGQSVAAPAAASLPGSRCH